MIKKKILIVTSEFPPQPGGIGNHAYNLAHQLTLNSCDVSLIADQRSLDAVEEREFDRTLDFKVFRIKIKRLRFLMYFNRLFQLLALADSADVIIASGKFSLWNVALCSFFKRTKTVAVIHGTEVNFKNIFIKKSIERSLKRFDTIIAVSNYTKSLIAYLNLEVTVIPNGFDSSKWMPGIIPSDHLTGSPKLITVGNVTSRKGQRNVIAHLPVLKLSYPNIHYHCIGLTTEAKVFLKEAHDLGVQDQVTFHGRLDDVTMQALLMASDIFVMLSSETTTGDVEGFGIAVIEANALGIPAIGARGSGLEDAIVDQQTGFLVDAMDTDEFIEKLRHLLEHYKTFSLTSEEWAFKHRWNAIIESYLKILYT